MHFTIQTVVECAYTVHYSKKSRSGDIHYCKTVIRSKLPTFPEGHQLRHDLLGLLYPTILDNLKWRHDMF